MEDSIQGWTQLGPFFPQNQSTIFYFQKKDRVGHYHNDRLHSVTPGL